MAALYLIRGLPGVGKTTLARTLAPIARAHSADDYFTNSVGVYTFNADAIAEAHQQCQRRTIEALRDHTRSIVVHNTFTQRWEVDPYIAMQRHYSMPLIIISLFDGGMDDITLARRCVHGVPAEVILKMRERWQHDLGRWAT